MNAELNPRRDDRGLGRVLKHLALVGQVGFTIMTGTLMGLAAGWWLDRKFGTSPWLLLAGLLLGLAGGGMGAYKTIESYIKE